jgi:hypothetical protein
MKFHTGICMQKVKEAAKHLSQHNWLRIRDLKFEPQETEVPTNQPRRSPKFHPILDDIHGYSHGKGKLEQFIKNFIHNRRISLFLKHRILRKIFLLSTPLHLCNMEKLVNQKLEYMNVTVRFTADEIYLLPVRAEGQKEWNCVSLFSHI